MFIEVHQGTEVHIYTKVQSFIDVHSKNLRCTYIYMYIHIYIYIFIEIHIYT
jgi:hypothetical protein